jgi:hypothetical protein
VKAGQGWYLNTAPSRFLRGECSAAGTPDKANSQSSQNGSRQV